MSMSVMRNILTGNFLEPEFSVQLNSQNIDDCIPFTNIENGLKARILVDLSAREVIIDSYISTHSLNRCGRKFLVSTVTGLGRILMGLIHTIVHLAKAILFDRSNQKFHLHQAQLGLYHIGRGLVEMFPGAGNLAIIKYDDSRIKKLKEEHQRDAQTLLDAYSANPIYQRILTELKEIENPDQNPNFNLLTSAHQAFNDTQINEETKTQLMEALTHLIPHPLKLEAVMRSLINKGLDAGLLKSVNECFTKLAESSVDYNEVLKDEMANWILKKTQILPGEETASYRIRSFDMACQIPEILMKKVDLGELESLKTINRLSIDQVMSAVRWALVKHNPSFRKSVNEAFFYGSGIEITSSVSLEILMAFIKELSQNPVPDLEMLDLSAIQHEQSEAYYLSDQDVPLWTRFIEEHPDLLIIRNAPFHNVKRGLLTQQFLSYWEETFTLRIKTFNEVE